MKSKKIIIINYIMKRVFLSNILLLFTFNVCAVSITGANGCDYDSGINQYNGVPYTCFSEAFSDITTRGAGDTTFGLNNDPDQNSSSGNWLTVAKPETTKEYLPGNISGRLVLTNTTLKNGTADGGEAGTATLMYLIPGYVNSKFNQIIIDFDYFSTGGNNIGGYAYANGADGVSVVLSDASISPQVGRSGGTLGYAANGPGSVNSGFKGGWLGLGITELDSAFHFFTSANNKTGAGLRGSYGATIPDQSINAGYNFIPSSFASIPATNITNSAGQHFRLTITATTPTNVKATLDRGPIGGTLTNLFSNIQVSTSTQKPLPKNLLLSFSGSTGGGVNNHEFDNIRVQSLLPMTRYNGQVHHFEFEFDQNGGNVDTPFPINVKSCADDTCSSNISGTQSITLTDVTNSIYCLLDTSGNCLSGILDSTTGVTTYTDGNGNSLTSILSTDGHTMTNSTLTYVGGFLRFGIVHHDTAVSSHLLSVDIANPGFIPFNNIGYQLKCNGIKDTAVGGVGACTIPFDYSPVVMPYCVSDNFSNNASNISDPSHGLNNDMDGNPTTGNWATVSNGDPLLPSLVTTYGSNGRIRLTNLGNDQSSAATFMYSIPGYINPNTPTMNYFVVDFDAYAHDGTGADGLAAVLSDARISPFVGRSGGTLGYAAYANTDGQSGFSGGWLGLGIFELKSAFDYGKTAGAGFALRGSYDGTGATLYKTGYSLIKNSGVTTAVATPAGGSTPFHYKLIVDARNGINNTTVQVIQTGGGSTVTTPALPVNIYDTSAHNYGAGIIQKALPQNLLLSFTGGNGGQTNYHEIDNVKVCSLLPFTKIVGKVHHFEFDFDPSGDINSSLPMKIYACTTAACNKPADLLTDKVDLTLADMPASSYCTLNAVGACQPSNTAGADGATITGTMDTTDPQMMTGTVVTFSGGSTTIGLVHPVATSGKDFHLIEAVSSDPAIIPFIANYQTTCNGSSINDDGGKTGAGNYAWDNDVTKASNCAITFVNVPSTPFCQSDNGFIDMDTDSVNGVWKFLSAPTVASPPSHFYQPNVMGSRLRLTDLTSYEATLATFLWQIPTSGNYFTIDFAASTHGGQGIGGYANGADGMAMVLSNASDLNQLPDPGQPGGSLGYANANTYNGFRGGWLGLGIDEAGNYSSTLAGGGTANGSTGYPNSTPNSVSVRGSSNGSDRTKGYAWLRGVQFGSGDSIVTTDANAKDQYYRMVVNATQSGHTYVSLKRSLDGVTWSSDLFNNLDLDPSVTPAQNPLPPYLYFSFTSSTGQGVNHHEMSNVKLCSHLPLVRSDVHHYEFSFDQYASTQAVQPITIRACANEDCSVLSATQNFSVTLDPLILNAGSWGAGILSTYAGCSTTDASCLALASNLKSSPTDLNNREINFINGEAMFGLSAPSTNAETSAPVNFPTLNINSATPSQIPFGPAYLYKCNGVGWHSGDDRAVNTACNLYFANQMPAICTTDTFDSLSNWLAPTGINYTANVVNGRLRLTDHVNDQASVAVYQPSYLPTSGGYVEISFDHFAYGTIGGGGAGDGLSLIFADASVPLQQVGPKGGGLGYSKSVNGNGYDGGWLGIGFDEFGNFSSSLLTGDKAPGRAQNTVALRGQGFGTPGNYTTGYGWLKNASVAGGVSTDALTGQKDHYSVVIESAQNKHDNQCNPSDPTHLCVTVKRSTTGGASYVTLIDHFEVVQQLPDALSFAFGGSTGGADNIHEVDNFRMCSMTPPLPMTKYLDHYEFIYDKTTASCMDKKVTIKACSTPSCGPEGTDTTGLIDNTQVIVAMTHVNGMQWVCAAPMCQNVLNINGDTITFEKGIATVGLRNDDNYNANVAASGVHFSWLSSVPTYKPFSSPYHSDICDNGTGPVFVGAGGVCLNAQFTTSGIAITKVTDGIAGKPNEITFMAVRSGAQNAQNVDSGIGGRCIPRFQDTIRDVSFSAEHVTPDTGGTSLQINPLVASFDVDATLGVPFYSPAYQPDYTQAQPTQAALASWLSIVNGNDATSSKGTLFKNVYFDHNGQATVQVLYPDAGKLALHIAYDGTTTTDEAVDGTNLQLSGASNPFVVRPYGLSVMSTLLIDACSTTSPLTSSNCPQFASAEQFFPIMVTAKQWMATDAAYLADPLYPKVNDPASATSLTWSEAINFNQWMNETGRLDVPSFKLSDVSLKLSDNLVAPANGVLPNLSGTLNNSQFDPVDATTINTKIDNVGVIEIAAGTGSVSSSVTGTPYLTGTVIPATVSGHIGTFVPDVFQIGNIAINNTEGTFSYMDHNGVSVGYDIIAKSALNNEVSNYQYFSPRATFALKMIDEVTNNLLTNQHDITYLPACSGNSVANVSCSTVASDWNGSTINIASTINFERIISNVTNGVNTYTPDGPYLINPTVYIESDNSFNIPLQKEIIPIPSPYINTNPKSLVSIALADDATPETQKIDLRFGYLKVLKGTGVNADKTAVGDVPNYMGAVNGSSVNINFQMQYWDDSKNDFVDNLNDHATKLYLFGSGEDSSNVGHRAINQCRSIGINKTINSYLMIPEFLHATISGGKGTLSIKAPNKVETAVNYWFLQSSVLNNYECNPKDVESASMAIGQPWLQFDHRSDLTNGVPANVQVSPHAVVTFKKEALHAGGDRKVIFKKAH